MSSSLLSSSSGRPATRELRMGRKLQSSKAIDAHEHAYLRLSEIDRLLDAARGSPNGICDYTMVLLTYRHGLHAFEAVRLQRDEVNLSEARILVRRAKGLDSQPLTADEVLSIQDYLAVRDDSHPWLFLSERGKQLARRSVNCIIGEAGKRAGLGSVQPCMLRYSCGQALANKGLDVEVIQDWLGERHPTRSPGFAARCLHGVWD